jgi:hypothetical protein
LLQIQPKISAIPEYCGQHQRRVGRDCTAIVTQLIHGFSTDSQCFSQLSLSQRHGHEEFLGNHFTDTYGWSFCDIYSLPHQSMPSALLRAIVTMKNTIVQIAIETCYVNQPSFDRATSF